MPRPSGYVARKARDLVNEGAVVPLGDGRYRVRDGDKSYLVTGLHGTCSCVSRYRCSHEQAVDDFYFRQLTHTRENT